MKIVSWLIVIIILVVNFMPCKDNNAGTIETNRISRTIEEHGHSKSDFDSCSPFCTCSCCNTPTYINQTVYIRTISLMLKKKYVDMYSANTASISLSVWQPPKLS